MQATAGSGEGSERRTDLIGVPVSRERQREGMGVTPVSWVKPVKEQLLTWTAFQKKRKKKNSCS